MIHRIPLLSAVVAALFFAGSTPSPTTTRSLHTLARSNQFASAFQPSQIADAYSFTPLYDRNVDGTGQTVALIEIDSYNPDDIHQFDVANNLPDPSVKEFYVDGNHFALEHSGETTMDLEWLHALAPGAAVQIYYLFNKAPEPVTWKSLADALRMAANNGASVVSISLGTCGPGPGSSKAHSALHTMQRLGVSVFVSSGDTGAHPGSVRDCGNRIAASYPAGDPAVVSVGGTSLELNQDNSIGQETAWGKSGGGPLKTYARPSWQVAPQLPRDRYRWVPDVAFVGNVNTGVAVFYKGDWHQAGGTSLGAPAWAAIWALLREDGQNNGRVVGSAPALLYRIANSNSGATAFHDITVGSNQHYHAGPGWDALTGWGTPNVDGLSRAVSTLAARS